jgi:hypothetical protein
MDEMFGEPAHRREQQEHFRKNRWLKKEGKLPLLHSEVFRIRIRALIIRKAKIGFCIFFLFQISPINGIPVKFKGGQ